MNPGDHVGIWSMNCPEWVVAQFATARIGAVLVNINPAYRLHELEEALRLADVSTLIVGLPFKFSNFVEMVQAICPEVASAESPDWHSERLPKLRRVMAIGDRPGPGWLDSARAMGKAQASSTRSSRPSALPTWLTSSSLRAPPGCRKVRC